MTTSQRAFLLFTALYLLSFAVLAGWFVLLIVGLLLPEAMALANRIALPVLVGSVLSLEVFRRLARRAESRLA
jgi:hypothetical protein